MSDFKGDSGSDAGDVLNLKVVDIKKRLKALGLPSTGKKLELVARLQAALMAGRDAAAPLDSACGSSPSKVKAYVPEDTLPSSEVRIRENEDSGKSEEIYLSEDLDESFHSKDLEIDLKDEDSEKEDFKEHELSDQSQVFTRSENVGKSQDVEIFQIVSTTLVPSIKRCLPQEEVETVKPRKKMVLKGNNFLTPILAAKVGKADEGEVNQSGDIAEKSSVVPGTPNESRKPIVTKFTNNPYRGLSDSAKQEKRAIRFNMSSQDFTENLTAGNGDKKHVSKSQQTVQKTENIAYPAQSLDVLRKRAERFGETVSTVLKKLEDKEKLNQRKIRFGMSASGNKDDDELEDEEKLNQRKIRFGISASGNKDDDEDKKRKRAERFGK